jgi:enamine deaminase RidA (YjgF/YER057c/UK114 family)
MSRDKVAKVGVSLAHSKNFAGTDDVNQAYYATHSPTRSSIEAKSLAHKGLEIDIEGVAVI